MFLVRSSQTTLRCMGATGSKQLFNMGLRQQTSILTDNSARFYSMKKIKAHYAQKQMEEKTEIRGASPKPRIYLDSVGSPIDEYKPVKMSDILSLSMPKSLVRVFKNLISNFVTMWRASRSIEGFSSRKFKPTAKEIYNDFYTSFTKGDLDHLRHITSDTVFNEVKAKLAGYKHTQGQEIKWQCSKLSVDVQAVRHAVIQGPEFEFLQAQVLFSGDHQVEVIKNGETVLKTDPKKVQELWFCEKHLSNKESRWRVIEKREVD
eukprot:TRINITY_DN12550_c0_g1_i1.p1 TRINITY_DN12550_c0_g1~~TRINITY_DN12550_c0_g1_i1.p1  ORF type:complete len:269 (+),score=112.79 TRINITY_DN12550_c0_g1_i1:23-808(+)